MKDIINFLSICFLCMWQHVRLWYQHRSVIDSTSGISL